MILLGRRRAVGGATRRPHEAPRHGGRPAVRHLPAGRTAAGGGDGGVSAAAQRAGEGIVRGVAATLRDHRGARALLRAGGPFPRRNRCPDGDHRGRPGAARQSPGRDPLTPAAGVIRVRTAPATTQKQAVGY